MLYRLYKALGPFLGVASFCLALDGIYVADPKHWTEISSGWTFAGYSLLAGLIASLFHALLLAHRDLTHANSARESLRIERDAAVAKNSFRPPRVVQGMTRASGDILLLLEPNPLFGTGLAVSIYSSLNRFDVLLGEGRVLTIQHDGGNIQVEITSVVGGTDDTWANLSNNDPSTLKATFGRPGAQAA